MQTLIMRALGCALLTTTMASCSEPEISPCVNEYPSIAGDILTSYGGRVARIEPVEWLEDGVYRIVVESGGEIMTKPGNLPMPPIGAELELRIFSDTRNSEPFAGCYCQAGTSICVEEYAYP